MPTDAQILTTALKKDIHVIDSDRGYLSVPSYNIRMDPKLLQAAARMIRAEFADKEVSVIHGIPNSGHFLATAVALEFGAGVRLHNSRKDNQLPSAWKEIVRTEVRSFSNQTGFDTVSGLTLASVHKGDRVLVVDDVCGRGDTGTKVVQALLGAGAQVIGFAVMLDKVFQGGLARIGEIGIRTYSCVRVKAIGKADQVEL